MDCFCEGFGTEQLQRTRYRVPKLPRIKHDMLLGTFQDIATSLELASEVILPSVRRLKFLYRRLLERLRHAFPLQLPRKSHGIRVAESPWTAISAQWTHQSRLRGYPALS